jgi:alpha-tubulin suppressor-like RCC1 family protein
VGYGTSCGIRGGVASCWGYGGWGQLGNGSLDDRLAPTAIDGAFTSIEAGSFYACARSATGALFCWGAEQSSSPTEIIPGVAIQAISEGEGSTCAIIETGGLYCWNGISIAFPGVAAQEIGSTWRAVASCDTHWCAIDGAGALSCWGTNFDGQLGLGDLVDRADPTRIGVDTWLAVAVDSGDGAYGAYTCGITDDGGRGRLFCWGSANFGRLGDGAAEGVVPDPTQVGTDDDWVSVSAGDWRACGIRADGSLWCWGANGDGGVGIGMRDDELHLPTRIGPDLTWSDVSVADHTCATATDGSFWCWGYGARGELGEGAAWRTEPTPVAL